VLLAALLAAAAPAVAQDDTAEARRQFTAGVSAFEGERYEEALAHFQSAYQLHPHPSIEINLANCYARLDRPAGAVLYYRAYLADHTVQIPRGVRHGLESDLSSLEARVGTLELDLTPPDAGVTIDGEAPEAREGTRILVTAGRHRVTASAPGRVDATQTIDVPARAVISLTLATQPPAPAPEPEPEAPAPAPSPAPPPAAPPPAAEEPSAPSAPVPEAPPATEPRGGVPGFARWGAVGLTAATAVTAAVLGALALDANSTFDDEATRIERGEVTGAERDTLRAQAIDDAHRANDLALVTDVLIGVTAAAAAATVVLFVVGPAKEPESRAQAPLRLDLAASGRSFQAGLQGHF
jgi:hypothetical protein